MDSMVLQWRTALSRVMSNIYLRAACTCRHCGRCMLYVCVLAVVVVILLAHEFILTAINLPPSGVRRSELKTEACPACFGQDFCPYLDKYRRHPEMGSLLLGNGKGVHFGSISRSDSEYAAKLNNIPDNTKVVAKSLAFDQELRTVNRKICRAARRTTIYSGDCDASMADVTVGRLAAAVAEKLLPDPKQFYNVSAGSDSLGLHTCVGAELHRLLVQVYDSDGDGLLTASEAATLRTVLMVNSEAAVLKAFPASHGWPFPHYYGACGRMIFVENAGDEAAHYLTHAWAIRVRVAVALMDAVIKLTDNVDQWIFYLLDLQLENFSVRLKEQSGEFVVKLIDLEHVLVVHKQDPVYTPGEVSAADVQPTVDADDGTCPIENIQCQTFYTPQLCAAGQQDINYFYVCRNLLFSNLKVLGGKVGHWTGGLLHTAPVNMKSTLLRMLTECIYDRQRVGRGQVFYKLKRYLAQSYMKDIS